MSMLNQPFGQSLWRWVRRVALAILTAGALLHVVNFLVMACLRVGEKPTALPSNAGNVRFHFKDVANPGLSLGSDDFRALEEKVLVTTGAADKNAVVVMGRRMQPLEPPQKQRRPFGENSWIVPEQKPGVVALPKIPIQVTIREPTSYKDGVPDPVGKWMKSESHEYTPASKALRPRVDFAYLAMPERVLWVAGQTAASSEVKVLDADGDHAELGNSIHDSQWLFDVLKTGCPASLKRVKVICQPHGHEEDLFTEVAVTVVAKLPLRRKVEMSFPRGKPEMKFEVTVPVAHPAFHYFAEGWLQLREFGNRFVDHPIWKAAAPPEFEIQRQGDEATVSWTSRCASVVDAVSLESEGAVAKHPWVSAEDSLRIAFTPKVRRAWIEGPLPTTEQGDAMTWKGTGLAMPMTEVGLGLDTGLQAEVAQNLPDGENDWDEKPKAAPTPEVVSMKAYVSANRGPWRAWLEALPLLGVLWLACRRPFGAVKMWNQIAAGAAVLTVLANWTTLYRIGVNGLVGGWGLTLTFRMFEWPTAGSESLRELFANAHSCAFFITLAAVTCLVPAYCLGMEAAGEPDLQLPQRGKWPLKRKRWRIVVMILSFGGALALSHLQWGYSFIHQAMVEWMKQPGTDLRLFYDIRDLMQSGGVLALIVAVWLLPGLILLGLGGGCGLLGAALWATKRDSGGQRVIADAMAWLPELPRALLVLAVVVMTFPLLLKILRALVPKELRPQFHESTRAAAWMTMAACVLMPLWGGRGALILTEIMLFAGLSWAALSAVRESRSASKLSRWICVENRWIRWPIAVALTVLLAWPERVGSKAPMMPDMFSLLSIAAEMLTVLGGMFLVLQFREHALGPRGLGLGPPPPAQALDGPVMTGGIVFFSLFIVQNPSTWLFLPVPYIAGWLLVWTWLLKGGPNAWDFGGNAGPLISALFAIRRQKASLGTVEKNLNKKLESGDLTPADHESALAKFRAYFAAKGNDSAGVLVPHLQQGIVLADWQPWPFALTCCGYGALMALVPVLVTLYDYLPGNVPQHPFPTAQVLSVLLRSAGSWLFIAFFFGYFFPRIRGHTGLAKGSALSIAIVAPLAIYRLLNAPTLAELQLFLLWAVQMFMYCTLLGLLAADRRALTQNGYAGRDLLTFHPMGWMSVYASSLIAAVTSGAIVALSGGAGMLVKFFIEAMLGGPAKGG